MRWVLAVLLAMLRVAAAQPVLDVGAVPGLDDAGRAAYAVFLEFNLPRAFAIGDQEAFGWHGGDGTAEAAEAEALAGCARFGEHCRLYAVDLDVVGPGAGPVLAGPPGPLVSGPGHVFVPDARYFWHGPAAAAGVYVWAHGFTAGVDSRGSQPPPHVRALNNAGYDVVRFDRETEADADRDRVAGWFADGLAELRRQGYRSVVAGGQSRGAWNSLQLLERPGLADAVIAVVPAAHGTEGSPRYGLQLDELRRLVQAVPPSSTRLAFVQFEGDPFAADLARRRALIEQLQGRLGAVLVIDRPAALAGHDAGGSAAFSVRYGACLRRFVMEADPPGSC